MEQSHVIDAIRKNADAIKLNGATSLHIFGSRARGTDDEGSDLDIFVDYDRSHEFSLLNLIRIKRLLEQTTGLPADITTRESLSAELRVQIEAEAIRVF